MAATVIINGDKTRENASHYVSIAPLGTTVTFKAPKRTLPQNDRLWAMLTDVAAQLDWHGVKIKANDWKIVFLDSLKREVRAVPNIDGTGFVNIGTSSSELSVAEMGDLMEIIAAFGASHGVVFHDGEQT